MSTYGYACIYVGLYTHMYECIYLYKLIMIPNISSNYL